MAGPLIRGPATGGLSAPCRTPAVLLQQSGLSPQPWIFIEQDDLVAACSQGAGGSQTAQPCADDADREFRATIDGVQKPSAIAGS